MRGRLLADGGGAVVPLHWSRELYNVASFTIGTPPQPASAFIDVGGLLVWTQCSQCSSSSCFNQGAPAVRPDQVVPPTGPEPCGTALCEFFPASIRNCSGDVCAYEASTQLFEHTSGKIGTDAVAIGTATAASVAFGCVMASDIKLMDGGPSGFVGLARTPLSLVAQMNVTAFSHCLAPHDGGGGKNSRLFLGAAAKLAGGGKSAAMTTPFVKSSPDDIKSLYYLINLEGIKAGDEAIITVPQSGRTVLLQTFSPVSFLVDGVYQDLKKAVTAAVGGPTATPPEQFQSIFDLCFKRGGVSGAPDVVLTFQGAAALTVPPTNYLLDVGDDTVCVAIASSARLNSTEVAGMSILGGLQQQNVHFLYDLEKETLSFEAADCSSLSPN
ncbi:hypothetical protein OsJ_32295 [Oryza sativa Japonica Group]|uniref:Peptidase A1 domain-containing protein n=1 Tax=Oryza sativa subsp. japonica TaxID=39947 RepID=A3C6W0_ORYSJ|nr:hypothetical protein OsJ_32295 [Oryza sativa Japonica Group]